MERTWRWFGRKDQITLDMLRQIGVQGIVTALHDVPLGQVWTQQQIHDLKTYIESHGMRWSVVESLPVTETIKYGGPDRDEQISIYCESLRNLAAEGIHIICYNFMPVSFQVLGPDGKPNGRDILKEVAELRKQMTPEKDHELVENIVIKTQGFVSGNFKEGDEHPLGLFRELLKKYEGIGREQLRANMKYFLDAIMPVCEECDMYMCVHPDDPPFQILGLPRIITCADDIEWLLNAVPNKHNGLTFCAGSLSAGAQNDLPEMARRFASRTSFVHLRSCHVFPNGDFTEASHLGGRADLVALAHIFEQEEQQRKVGKALLSSPNAQVLPMRVDHGMTMLGDEKRGYNAGYSFLGRMFAMGQVQGILAAVDKELGIKYEQPGFFD